jgi:hypothetical protein
VKHRAGGALALTILIAAGCGAPADADPAPDGAAPVSQAPAALADAGAAACPATPTGVVLRKIAPVWGGLVVVEARVPDGVVDQFDVALFDPSVGAWVTIYPAQASHRADGTFQLELRPQVNDASFTGNWKARLRARLLGCAPSAWAESDAFTLGNPLAGTTWVARTDPSQVATSFQVNLPGGSYTITSISGIVHQVSFAAGGALGERWSYDIKTNAPGAPYDGCHIDLAYAGAWKLQAQYGALQLLLSDRRPVVGGDVGTICGNPSRTSFYYEQPQTIARLVGVNVAFNPDYQPLTYTTPGPVRWNSGALFGSMVNTLVDLSVPGSSLSVTGGLSTFDASYVRE